MRNRKRFGELMLEVGIVDEATLRSALARQKSSGKQLGQVLEEMGVVTERDIAVAVARQFGLRTVRNFARFSFSESLLRLVDADTALKSLFFPLKLEKGALLLAMVNPFDRDVHDYFSFRHRLKVVPCVTTPSEIQTAINRHYLKNTEDARMEKSCWTILVVEDQASVRTAIAAALQKERYEVVQAENGAEGLKTALQVRPHLIIADTMMPRMDGLEMFRTLQSHAITRGIPVVALTSKAMAEEEAKLLDQGYFDFIAKPVNAVRLAARVRKALRSVYGKESPHDAWIRSEKCVSRE